VTDDAVAREREHQDAWYTRAVRDRFFDREGFRRLTLWNLQCLRRAVPLTPSSRVLSIGCGTGEYELRLAPSISYLCAFDLSPIAVAEARQRAIDQHRTNLDFEEASLVSVTFPAGSFDAVYAMGVLHHLSRAERQALLVRVRQWLAPGGSFYARDPNAGGILRRIASPWSRRPEFHSPNEAALSPGELRQELLAAGFSEPTIGYTDVLGGPLPWLVRSSSKALWDLVFAFDRVWLATPGLRKWASQFDICARR
jgi:SAM-dependent methyltransferase